jgi:hypothetical protein
MDRLTAPPRLHVVDSAVARPHFHAVFSACTFGLALALFSRSASGGYMSYRWLRMPMLGAMALTMMLAATGAAQAAPRGADGYGQARYDSAYREGDYRSGYDDGYRRHGDRRVMYRGGRRVVVVYVRPHSRYDRYHRYERYHRYHRYDRYHDRW